MGDNGATWLVRLAVVMPLSSAPVLSSRLRLSRREQGELTKFDTVSPETEFAALTGQRWHQAAYWCHREGSLPGPQLIVAAARLMREFDKGLFAEIAVLVPPFFPEEKPGLSTSQTGQSECIQSLGSSNIS